MVQGDVQISNRDQNMTAQTFIATTKKAFDAVLRKWVRPFVWVVSDENNQGYELALESRDWARGGAQPPQSYAWHPRIDRMSQDCKKGSSMAPRSKNNIVLFVLQHAYLGTIMAGAMMTPSRYLVVGM